MTSGGRFPTAAGSSTSARCRMRRCSDPQWPRRLACTRLRSTPCKRSRRILTPRSALLILDGCERLLDPCARLTDELRVACPQLRILATSREPLHRPGEQVVRVSPLTIPAPRGGGFPGVAWPLRVGVVVLRPGCGGVRLRADRRQRGGGGTAVRTVAGRAARDRAGGSPDSGPLAADHARPAHRPVPTIDYARTLSPPSGTARFERARRGATTCAPRPNRSCGADSRCSPAAATCPPSRRPAPAGRYPRTTSSTCWSAWWRSRSCTSYPATTRTAMSGIGCSMTSPRSDSRHSRRPESWNDASVGTCCGAPTWRRSSERDGSGRSRQAGCAGCAPSTTTS